MAGAHTAAYEDLGPLKEDEYGWVEGVKWAWGLFFQNAWNIFFTICQVFINKNIKFCFKKTFQMLFWPLVTQLNG